MNSKNGPGYTLIELMITVALLGVIGVGAYRLFTENALHHKNNIYRQKAIYILKSQAALLRARPFRGLPRAGDFPFFDQVEGIEDLKQARAKMSVVEMDRDLRKFILKISWLDARQKPGEYSLVLYRAEP